MRLISLLLFLLISSEVFPQEVINYDETKVPAYKLPDPLKCFSGQKVRNLKTWEKKRKPEIKDAFEQLQYGKIPGDLPLDSWQIAEESDKALGGKAIRRQVVLTFRKNGMTLNSGLLIYLPKKEGKVPVFLGYNFNGNHAVLNDPEIIITDSWARNEPSYGTINNQFTEQSRGVESDLWAIERIIKSGYGVATMYYGDIDPDKDDFSDGIHPFFYKKGQVKPGNNEWGSIAAWAWGLSRALDYLEKDPSVDASKVIVMGHSRNGKTALWAGATDPRFAIVISNNSGCCGAALSKRKFGETVQRINNSFPHWFCGNFKSFNNNESSLPVDQHELIALIAPRPVYIASAAEDQWADPKGEYLGGYFASPVFKLYGKTGLTAPDMPPVNQPVMNTIGYHIRTGKHSVTNYDWEQYIHFADLHFKNK